MKRGFDLLLFYSVIEVKEEELRRLLKFDSKTLRIRLASLKADRIIKTRRSEEPGNHGTKIDSVKMDYKSFLGVMLMKLEGVRKKIHDIEQGCAPKEFISFKCTRCPKKYHELQAGELFIADEEVFRCSYCRGLVEEEEIVPNPVLVTAK